MLGEEAGTGTALNKEDARGGIMSAVAGWETGIMMSKSSLQCAPKTILPNTRIAPHYSTGVRFIFITFLPDSLCCKTLKFLSLASSHKQACSCI